VPITPEAALKAAVRQNLLDVAPRLVYADGLGEQGRDAVAVVQQGMRPGARTTTPAASTRLSRPTWTYPRTGRQLPPRKGLGDGLGAWPGGRGGHL